MKNDWKWMGNKLLTSYAWTCLFNCAGHTNNMWLWRNDLHHCEFIRALIFDTQIYRFNSLNYV